jgi:hypothetical protein
MAGWVRWLNRYQVQNIKRIIKARVVYDLEKKLGTLYNYELWTAAGFLNKLIDFVHVWSAKPSKVCLLLSNYIFFFQTFNPSFWNWKL